MVFHEDYDTITEQLNSDLISRLYYECLLGNFLKSYDKIFALPKQRKHSRYTWADEVYCNMIMDLTKRLEPIRYKSNTVLFDELNEFTQVIFPMTGSYKIGFSINKKEEFVLYYKKNVIGAYPVTFNKRCLFIYKTVKPMTGFFIRKIQWLNVINNKDYSEIADKFKEGLIKNYESRVKNRVLKAKMVRIAKEANRSDYTQVLSLVFLKKEAETRGTFFPDSDELKMFNAPNAPMVI